MRQLTSEQEQIVVGAFRNHLLCRDYDCFEAGFIAGLEHQDKRIEALEAKLLAWEQYNDGLINRKELAFRLMAEVTK